MSNMDQEELLLTSERALIQGDDIIKEQGNTEHAQISYEASIAYSLLSIAKSLAERSV